MPTPRLSGDLVLTLAGIFGCWLLATVTYKHSVNPAVTTAGITVYALTSLLLAASVSLGRRPLWVQHVLMLLATLGLLVTAFTAVRSTPDQFAPLRISGFLICGVAILLATVMTLRSVPPMPRRWRVGGVAVGLLMTVGGEVLRWSAMRPVREASDDLTHLLFFVAALGILPMAAAVYLGREMALFLRERDNHRKP